LKTNFVDGFLISDLFVIIVQCMTSDNIIEIWKLVWTYRQY